MAKVLVLVGGSVAAIKVPSLLRRLREAGHQIRVAASPAALEFVSELSLATAAGQAPATDRQWFAPVGRALHLELAHWAELIVIAPASAELMAQAALGLAGSLIPATLLSTRAQVLWVPAMNPAMWQHPATQGHRQILASWGQAFLGPEYGALGTVGEGEGQGRMAEPNEIVAQVKALLTPKDLAGLRLLISAGPTREYLDPVRFISNPSSGRMGYAVAQASRDRGASVTLVSGPVNLEPPYGVELIGIESALELRQAMLDRAPKSDAVVMTAAVADYRPETYVRQKVPKGPEALSLKLIRNPDILAELGQTKPGPILVGFAMETEAGRERALAKVREKHLDFICLNFPTQEATPFGGDYNQITLVFPDGKIEELSRMSKLAAADVILDNIQKIWINKQ